MGKALDFDLPAFLNMMQIKIFDCNIIIIIYIILQYYPIVL